MESEHKKLKKLKESGMCSHGNFNGGCAACKEERKENKSQDQKQKEFVKSEKEGQIKKYEIDIGGANSHNSLEIEYRTTHSESGESISIERIKGHIELGSDEEFESFEKIKKMLDEIGVQYEVHDADYNLENGAELKTIEVDKQALNDPEIQKKLRDIFVVKEEYDNNRSHEYFTAPDILK